MSSKLSTQSCREWHFHSTSSFPTDVMFEVYLWWMFAWTALFSSTHSDFCTWDTPCHIHRFKSPTFPPKSNFKKVLLTFFQELLFCGANSSIDVSLNTTSLTSLRFTCCLPSLSLYHLYLFYFLLHSCHKLCSIIFYHECHLSLVLGEKI